MSKEQVKKSIKKIGIITAVIILAAAIIFAIFYGVSIAIAIPLYIIIWLYTDRGSFKGLLLNAGLLAPFYIPTMVIMAFI